MAKPSLQSFPNIPAPPGSKAGSSYSRIIPAEELGGYASWKPEAISAPGATQPAPGWSAQKLVEETPEAVWQQRLVQARKSGYEEGYRDGMAALESFKASHAQQVQAQWQQHLHTFTTALDAQMAALEPAMATSLAEAAVTLARSVLHAELELAPEHVLGLAQEAVALVTGSAKRIELQVHPQDLALVQESLGEWLAERGATTAAQASVGRHGCLVKADIAQVDARMATRWTRAAALLGSTQPWQAPAEEAPHA